MRVHVLGAAGTVTGSSYLVETEHARVLVDCGMYQGTSDEEARNRAPLGFDPAALDAVVLTHAHLDHCGRLPLLAQGGYRGRVVSTPATRELTVLILRDSAHIQEEDAAETDAPPPLYTTKDAEALLDHMQDQPYWEEREVAPGVRIRLHDAGHILGSASVRMTVEDGGRERTVAFSGDLGLKDAPILRDPSPPRRADLVFMESTYGDADHAPLEDTIADLREILIAAQDHGRRVLVPAFAVGRAQSLLYLIARMYGDDVLKDLPVFLDSPLASEATEVYLRHKALFDKECHELITEGEQPLVFPRLKLGLSRHESMKLNEQHGAFVVIAGSGMATGGRIVHHLKHHLDDDSATVVIAGFQAEGTLGRELTDGRRQVKVLGKEMDVRARIATLGGLSAHAGQSDLVAWARAAGEERPRLFLTHGEDPAREALKARIEREVRLDPVLPRAGDVVEL